MAVRLLPRRDLRTWIRRAANYRAPLFESIADLVIDVDVMRPAAIVSRILNVVLVLERKAE